MLLVSNPTHSHDYTLTGRGGGFGGCGETCNMAPWPSSGQVGFLDALRPGKKSAKVASLGEKKPSPDAVTF